MIPKAVRLSAETSNTDKILIFKEVFFYARNFPKGYELVFKELLSVFSTWYQHEMSVSDAIDSVVSFVMLKKHIQQPNILN